MNRAEPRVMLAFLTPAGTPFLQEDLSWQDSALCAQTDPEVFFPPQGGCIAVPKRICAGCDVRAECEEYAVSTGQENGIWGGMSPRVLRRRVRERAAASGVLRCKNRRHIRTAGNTGSGGRCLDCERERRAGREAA